MKVFWHSFSNFMWLMKTVLVNGQSRIFHIKTIIFYHEKQTFHVLMKVSITNIEMCAAASIS